MSRANATALFVALLLLPGAAEVFAGSCRRNIEGGFYGPYVPYYDGYVYLNPFGGPVANAYVPASPVQQHRLYYPDPVANFYFRSHAYQVYELRIIRDRSQDAYPQQPRYPRTYYARPTGRPLGATLGR